jgi:glyoxylase-like metal-dependent hydrolase (beta-lactamase superfamily II)
MLKRISVYILTIGKIEELLMLNKITESIFTMPNNDETDRPSLGLICGSKYSLIVDSGNSPMHAKEFLSEISLLKKSPLKYLILTHYHWDHIFGIQEMNLMTIAHQNTIKKINEIKYMKLDDSSLERYVREGIFSESTINNIKKEFTVREDFIVGDVDLLYKDELEIDLGGMICVIKAVGGPHTDDSTIIYVPSEKVMFLGDCIYGSSKNGKYGIDKEKLCKMINIIEGYDADYFIISHESVYNRHQMDDLWKQLKMLSELTEKEISAEETIKKFINTYHREPTEEEVFYINCLIN